jgi:hypothetical protein
MALHQRNDRGDFVNPSGAGPRPKLKVKRGDDGKVQVTDPNATPVHEETRPDERPPQPPDPRGPVNPHHAGL